MCHIEAYINTNIFQEGSLLYLYSKGTQRIVLIIEALSRTRTSTMLQYILVFNSVMR